MKRRFRLTSSTDIQRVRRFGKSFTHPLLVMVSAPNQLPFSRCNVIVGRSLGNAVQRNRIKRQLRAALHLSWPYVTPGWDIVFIARRSISGASFQEMHAVLMNLLRKGGLSEESYAF